MKIDRMIGILSVLLQKDMVTAVELAEKFEVSRRTINRDIEGLSQAGVPVYTRQGQGGGISIMDNYKLNRTLMTSKEMQAILAGLRSLDSVSGNNQYGQLMEKLQAGSTDFVSGNQSILIDLSSWYKESLAPKIALLQTAIEKHLCVRFQYYSPKGDSRRMIEPYYLIFKWTSWYIWGYCKERCNFRMFKLNRLERMELTQVSIEERQVPLPDLSNERIFPPKVKVKALFSQEVKWRLIEEFGLDCFTAEQDGRLLFEADYADEESLISWLLTFGRQAELFEPEALRESLKRTVMEMAENYGGKIIWQDHEQKQS